MPNRIDLQFADLRARRRCGLMAYITAGDPDLAATEDLVPALADAGVDFVELGVPFSDPLADGVVNQLAAQRALASGTTLEKVLACVHRIRQRTEVPLVLYTYLNPVYIHGFEKFHEEAAAAGVDGVLILDLPPDEIAANRELADRHQLKSIRLVAPTTPPARVEYIARSADGFIYYVSREGVTGEQSSLSDSIAAQVAEIKKHTELPIAVGFGISTPEQAATVARQADAVVVGSAIVRRMADHGRSADFVERVTEFVRPLADAVHNAARP
ncbi:MAG: tryptophan synthase subunit alpha [Chthoniobacterales bacterium]|nr:tryptophan synthase subunit alpha [Chthoniobacterales bacterium]